MCSWTSLWQRVQALPDRVEAGLAGFAGQLSCVRVLLKRTPVPQFSRAVVMHQWHKGRPPLPYLWVLRWLLCTSPEWAARGFGVAWQACC